MFKCGICGQASERHEPIGGRVPLVLRKVTYVTPQRREKDLRPSSEVVSEGTEIVREVVACAKCAATPPTPVMLEETAVVRYHPPRVIAEKKTTREGTP